MKDTSTSSYLSPTKRVWKGNWSLRIPNKVLKTLIRRAGLDSLPSRANLMKRKILSDDAYPNYNLDQETSHHALWSCPALASSWEVHFAWLIDDSRNCISFLDVIQLCQEKCNLTELFAMTASLIWSRKNQICVGEAAIPLGKINSMAMDNLQEFQRASSSPQTNPSVAQESKWLPPLASQLKINFEGATFKANNLASLEAIVRNDKGLVVAAFTQTISLPTLVEMVEVLAARSAICSARELNLEQVIVEGDSEIIIKAINSGGFVSSSFGFHHSSLLTQLFITHHSSLITHHLKYPNFPNPTRLALITQFCITLFPKKFKKKKKNSNIVAGLCFKKIIINK